MNRRSAIVLVTTSFPISGDGSEAAGSFVSDLAEELARHVPVRVVAPGRDSGQDRWAGAVDVFRYAAPGQALSTLRPWWPGDLLKIRAVLVAGQEATRRAVSAGPTSHVLALWALPSGHWARSVAAEVGLSYSVWTLGSDIWTLGRLPVVRAHLQRVLRGAVRRFSDGLRLAEDTWRIGGCPVEFLPSSRRISRGRKVAPRTAPPYRLLYLGRWHPNKGVDLMLEALTQLGDDDWWLIESVEICGGGSLENVVRSGVELLRSAGRPVSMRGYLDKASAEEAILGADYLLIPSRIESIPVVFSDAMQLGCPVVTMPVGDLPGLIGEGVGVLSTEVSATAFRVALVKALRTSSDSFSGAVARMAARFRMDSSVVPELLALGGVKVE